METEPIDFGLKGDRLVAFFIRGMSPIVVCPDCYDNPNVDDGNEDSVLKVALYREVMAMFLKRIEVRKQGGGR